jgi:hypothetical protein
MQDLSGPARSIMMRRLPDSGTPERSLIAAALAAPGAVVAPNLTLSTAAGLGLGMGLYSRPGVAAFTRAGNFSPVVRRAIRRAIERAGVAMTPMLGD